MNTELNDYISNRYNRWFDFSKYHCEKAKIPHCAVDILDEVLLSLFEKDENKVLKLYNSKNGDRTELDWYILRAIRLNVYSPTSPFQSKYRPIPNADVDHKRLNIPDCQDEEPDKPAILLEKFNQVREIFEQLHLSCHAKRVFEHRFFHDLSFSEWEGPETSKQLYDIYSSVVKLIKKRINGESLL